MGETKPGYFYKQSAVIPYRVRGREIDILLVTSRKKSRWIIPKGIIEPSATAKESAEMEALEEAGVKGDVHDKPLGTYSYRKWGGTCEVQVYAMEVSKTLNRWDEDFRDRAWVPLADALERVRERDLREILARMPNLIGID